MLFYWKCSCNFTKFEINFNKFEISLTARKFSIFKIAEIHCNWFNIINFKLILLTLLYFLPQIVTAAKFLSLGIVSVITHQTFVKTFYQKRWKTDIFNKSGFDNRKLIVIIYSFFSVVYLFLALDSPLDSHLALKAETLKIT